MPVHPLYPPKSPSQTPVQMKSHTNPQESPKITIHIPASPLIPPNPRSKSQSKIRKNSAQITSFPCYNAFFAPANYPGVPNQSTPIAGPPAG